MPASNKLLTWTFVAVMMITALAGCQARPKSVNGDVSPVSSSTKLPENTQPPLSSPDPGPTDGGESAKTEPAAVNEPAVPRSDPPANEPVKGQKKSPALSSTPAPVTANLAVTVLGAKTVARFSPRIAGARIVLTPGGHTSSTDSGGMALLQGIPAGFYKLRVEREGYEPYSEETRIPVLAGGSNANEVFLFEEPKGEPVASLALLGPTSKVPYNTPVYLSAAKSENASRHGFRWEIRNSKGELLTDPYTKTETPLQAEVSRLPGDNPYIFSFTPPAPGKYRATLILTNPAFGARNSTATVEVEAENSAPEAVASIIPGPKPPQKEPGGSFSSSSGLEVVTVGETVYLRGWGVDPNMPAPEHYNPGGFAPDLYGKNHDHYQRQFRWQWNLVYIQDGNEAGENEISLLKDGTGASNASVQYPHFAAAKPGRYKATLVIDDNDTYGAKISQAASTEVLVLPDDQKVPQETCLACHPKQAAGWKAIIHGQKFVGVSNNGPAAPACQDCHGPGQLHVTSDPSLKRATIGVTYRAGLCGQCHAEYGEWQKALHSDGDSYGYNEVAPVLLLNCTGCHYARGHVARTGMAQSKGKPFKDVNFSPANLNQLPAPGEEGVSCAACHDPHPGNSEAGLILRDGSPGQVCGTCHYEKWQNAILEGIAGEIRNGYEYPGENYSLKNPHNTSSKCVLCHMDSSNTSLDQYGIRVVGGHTLRMRDAGPNRVLGGYGPRPDNSQLERNPRESDDTINLAPCQKCHQGAESFDLKGTQERIYKKWKQLGELLKARNNGVLPDFKPGDKCAVCHRGGTLPFAEDPGLVLENAYTNYKLIKNDRSWGIHNPSYMEKLLDDSIVSVLKEDQRFSR